MTDLATQFKVATHPKLATRLKRAADQLDLIAILARARPMLVAELKADAAKYRRAAGEIEREDQTP